MRGSAIRGVRSQRQSQWCQISHPILPEALNQFGWRFKCIVTSAQAVDVQNLVEIDSAVMNLRMREKKRVSVWIFY